MAEEIGRLDREARLAAERDRDISAINTLLDEHSKMHLSHRDALIAIDGKVTVLDGRVVSLEREVRGLRSDMQSGFASLQRATEALAVKLDRLSPE